MPGSMLESVQTVCYMNEENESVCLLLGKVWNHGHRSTVAFDENA